MSIKTLKKELLAVEEDFVRDYMNSEDGEQDMAEWWAQHPDYRGVAVHNDIAYRAKIMWSSVVAGEIRARQDRRNRMFQIFFVALPLLAYVLASWIL